MKAMKTCGKVLLIIVIIALFILIIGLLFLNFWPSVGDTPGREKQEEYAGRTELYYDRQFHNGLDFEVMTGEASAKSDRNVPENKLPAEKIGDIDCAASGEMKIMWLGHSSSLLQMGDKNILIDPVMSDRSSPVGFAGPARFAGYALDTDSVPEIDVLFISHDHYDHLDYDTIKAIDGKVSSYVIPLGIDVILKGWGVDESKLHPLYWWEDVELDGVSYTVTPAEHYTGRNPLKNNATLWGGLYIRDGVHNFYYTGDTGYYDLFEQVYVTLGTPDLMLADSGQYDKGWATTHMFPEEAVQAAKDVHAKWLIPVHWGAYSLSNHAWDDPPQRAVKAAGEQGVNLATPRIGQAVSYDDIASFTEHWWEEYGAADTSSGILNTAAAWDFVDPQRIVLLGGSQGGAVTALTGCRNQDKIVGMMLMYPALSAVDDAHNQFNSIDDIPEEYDMFGGWIHVGRNYAADIWNLDFYDELAGYEGDVLLLHGDRDTTVDISYSEKAADVIPNCEFHVISNGRHEFFNSQFEEAITYILSYMEQFREAADRESDTQQEEKSVKDEAGMLKLTIGDTPVEVEWEDNESVEALKELVKDVPLTIQMSMYSTFEQVGSLGMSLPREDEQTTTEAGDIVLYSGNQIVVFYGSNSWAYTRFGKITDKTASEMAELLGNGDVCITISLE